MATRKPKKENDMPAKVVQPQLLANSRRTLEETPAKALRLLKGIGTDPAIRQLLHAGGYRNSDHQEGWTLLGQASGRVLNEDNERRTRAVADAIAALDAWDEGGFAMAGGALRRKHPAQAEFVFKNLKASQGPAAVLGVRTFLDRLDALENSPEREATRAEDHAALATLAQRGLDQERRRELRALVELAQSAPDISDELIAENETTTAAETEALIQLRAWYEDWTATARAHVTKKSHLIKLGLAKRAQGDDADDDDAPTE